jgi:hypothetical protein
MKDSMNVIDTRLPGLLRGLRPLLGMFVGVRYLPMVISGLIGTALRSALAGAREAT